MMQKNSNKQIKKMFSSRKFKYGTSAVIFTAVFVAVIILVNVLVSFIDSRTGGLYVDLTTKNLYGISDATRRELKAVDKPVEIIFCQPADKFSEYDELNNIKMLAESYAKEFDNVTVIYKDRLSDPAYFNQFVKSSTDQINTYSIIVNCPSSGRSVIYDYSDMYKFNQDGALFAFNGEYKLTSAILSTARTSDNLLKAGMITGHNELSPHVVRHTLEDYGYEVSNVDLKTISAQELATYNLLIVCDPTSDFIGMSNSSTGTAGPVNMAPVNESTKLLNYVINDLGNVMFFLDPNGKDLPELKSLIADGFGVEVDNLYYVMDAGTMLSNERFYGSYSLDTTTAGYALHKPLSQSGAGLPPVFGPSCSLSIPKENDDGFNITPIMTGSDKAVRVTKEGYEAAPNVPLMTLSRYSKIKNNKEVSGNVIVCASTGFISNLENNSAANGDLFKEMLISMGNDKIIVDIDFKVLDETGIDATEDMVESMKIRLAVIVPVIIAIAGLAVFIKRKYL